MAKENIKHDESSEALGQAVSKTEAFFQKNGNLITWIGVAIVAVAALVLLYINYILKPAQTEAQEMSYKAEELFRNGEYAKALAGEGDVMGFADIIDQYGSKAGSAVYFYAGICELQAGNAQGAIGYLKKYDGGEPILKARALCCIGDAYVGLDNLSEALNYYLKAAKTVDTSFAAAYWLKAAFVAEELGKTADALSYYQIIKDKYAATYEGYQIDKYISRLK